MSEIDHMGEQNMQNLTWEDLEFCWGLDKSLKAMLHYLTIKSLEN